MVASPAQSVTDYSTRSFVVGNCLITPKLGRIMRAGKTVQLEPKVMQVLVCLASCSRDVVSKQELLNKVWAGTFVSDHVLSHVIWQLRKALGSADLIETVPRRGYRLTVEAVVQLETNLPANGNVSRNGRFRWLLALATVVTVVTGTVALWVARHHMTAQQPIRRIVILPLDASGTGSSQLVMVEGINQSLRDAFLELRGLQVLSAHATKSALYAGSRRKSPLQLAKEARADAVLQGTAVVIDGRVRIGMDLWDAHSNRAILSQTFERDLQDLLLLYNEIVRCVAKAGRVPIRDEEAIRLEGPVLNPEAAREYLLGLGLPQVNRESIDHFRRAIALNPQFAPAYISTAVHLAAIANFDSKPPEQARLAIEARAMALKSIQTDPGSARAAAVLGWVEAGLFWNWKEAGKRFEDAEKLRPLDQTLLHYYREYLTITRQCDKAMDLVEREKQADPIGAWPLYYAHWTHYMCGQPEAAIKEAQAALARDASARWAHSHTAYCYALTGHYQEAIAECEKAGNSGKCTEPYLLAQVGREREAREILKRWEREGQPGAFFQALGYVGLREPERALEWLSKGYELRDPNMRFIWDPALAPLHNDPRFQQLTCKIGLPSGVCANAG